MSRCTAFLHSLALAHPCGLLMTSLNVGSRSSVNSASWRRYRIASPASIARPYIGPKRRMTSAARSSSEIGVHGAPSR